MRESASKTRVTWIVLVAGLILSLVAALAGGTSLAQTSPTPTPRSIVIGGSNPTPTPRVITTPRPTVTPPASSPTSTPFALATQPPISTAAPLPTAPPAPTATLPPPAATLPPPTLAPAAAMPTLAPAQRVHLDFTAADWAGGYFQGNSRFYGRPWVAVYGALSNYPQATLAFSLDRAPGSDATFTVTGLDDEWADLNPMSLTVNGQEVFRGASPFPNWDGRGNGANAAWTPVPFTISAGILRAGQNEITVANLTPVASFNSPPYILLSTATLDIAPGGQKASGVDFTAADWVGGFYRGDSQSYGRPWTAVYGAQSQYPRATLRFRLDGQPTGPATLTVTGLDDELPDLNPIAIEVNGQVAYNGPSQFNNWDGRGNGADAAWRQIEITIPAELLRSGRNEVAIANLSPSANFNGPPYILLADAHLDVPGVGITPLAASGDRRQGP